MYVLHRSIIVDLFGLLISPLVIYRIYSSGHELTLFFANFEVRILAFPSGHHVPLLRPCDSDSEHWLMIFSLFGCCMHADRRVLRLRPARQPSHPRWEVELYGRFDVDRVVSHYCYCLCVFSSSCPRCTTTWS